MNDGSSPVGRLLTWIMLAVAAVVALKVGFWLVGMAMGLAFFVLFTVVPLAIVGWIMVKLFRIFFRRDDEYRPA